MRKSYLCRSPKYHEAFLYRLHLVYNSNPLADWALANTVPSIHDGYVSKNGFYNWLVWGEMRKWVFQGLLGKRLRAMIIVGGESSSPQGSNRVSPPLCSDANRLAGTGVAASVAPLAFDANHASA